MNLETFWGLIDQAGNSSNTHETLRQSLQPLSAPDIAKFQSHFDQLFDSAYRWNLWGAAYIIAGGCSDDGFIDFRYGLISRGRTVFETTLANPDLLATLEIEEIEDEAFGYIAQEIYESKTGQSIPRDTSNIAPDPIGEEWDFDDEDENQIRLPMLMKKYW